MRRTRWLLLASVLTASCSKSSASPPPGDKEARAAEQRGEAPGLGEVMMQIGKRFEVAGRAAAANRFELAAFEVGELGELFESDVPPCSIRFLLPRGWADDLRARTP